MPQLTWFITGCSSGFGEAFVSAISARGDRIIATARNLDDIAHLAGENVHTLELDVTSTQEELNAKISAAQDVFGGINVLINNAGYIQGGPMEQTSGEQYLKVYNNNLVGTVNVTRAILPHFRKRNEGTVVFMGSQSGWIGDIGATPYCASKFAMEGLFEGFRQEIAPFGIKSIIFEPGFFRTNVFSPDHLKIEIEPMEEYEEMNLGIEAMAKSIHGNQSGDPKKAVERIIDIVRSEGMAAGKDMPIRLPLGRDALAVIRNKCMETLKICEEWEGLICSTDFTN